MKRIMKAAWIFAASALVFSSCMEEQILAPQDEQAEKVTVNITAGTLQTKTFLDGSTQVKWKGDETIEVLEQAGTSFHHVTSDPAVTPDGLTAKFKATLNAATATSFNYAAVYPSTSFVTNDNSAFDRMKLELPAEQHPTETSFDPAADLLVAKNVQLTAQPTDLNFQFARPVAVMEMTVKGLADGENIQSVQFSSTSAVLAGRMYYDFTTDKVIEYGYQGQDAHVINCLYDAPYAAVRAGNKIYFTVYPTADKQALADFSVTVNTDKATYTKDVKPANPLTIKANDLVRFGVANLTREAKILDEYALLTDASILAEGDKIIITNGADGSVMAMADKLPSKNRMDQVPVTAANKKITSVPAEANVLTLEGPADNFLLKGFGGYISLNGTQNELKYIDVAKDASRWKFSIPANGTNVDIISGTRPIRFNQPYFASYKSTGSCTPVYVFYKKGQPKTPLATPTELYAEQEDPNINAVTVIWSAVPDAASYTVTCGDNVQTVTETVATITDLAWETTHTISIVANPAAGSETLKSSAPATTTVTTGKNPNIVTLLTEGDYVVMYATPTSSYMGLTSTESRFNLQAAAVAYNGTAANVTVTKDLIWHIKYSSKEDAYSFFNAATGKYLILQTSGSHDNAKLGTAEAFHKLAATGVEKTFTIGSPQKLFCKDTYKEFTFDGTAPAGTDQLLIIPADVDRTPIYSLADATVEIPSAAATGHALTSVTANEYVQEKSFQVSSDQAWLKNLHVSGGQLLADVEANAAATARTATVTVTYPGAEVATQTLEVSQAAQGAAVEQTVSFTWNDVATVNNLTTNKELPASLEYGVFTFGFDKAGGRTSPRTWDSNSELRLYANNTVVIKVTDQTKKITKIEVSMSANVDTGVFKNNVWTGSANSVTFTINGKPKVKNFTITYE